MTEAVHALGAADPRLTGGAEPDLARGRGEACGTFGELMQGALGPGRDDFLVTLPIDCHSRATFVSSPDLDAVAVSPSDKVKSRALAELVLARYGLPSGGLLEIESELPEGKGLASSSADLVATARAVASCFDLQMHVTVLEQLMRRIEPSDGVMYPGVVAFFHRQVRLHCRIGSLPPLTIVGVDEGGSVDTLAFNAQPNSYSVAQVREYELLLSRLIVAVEREDLAEVGRVATRSALLNQSLNPKRGFGELLGLATKVGALGVVVAHSGTCLGVVLAPSDSRYRQQVRLARECVSKLGRPLVYSTLPQKRAQPC